MNCMETVENPGYHLTPITKGVVGEISKVVEEALEAQDAADQNASVMVIVELSDLVGAIKSYLSTHHPSISLKDLETMADITARAFASGRRSSNA